MNFVDTHCHLYSEEFENDITSELAKAKQANVDTIILPAIDSASHDRLFALASANPSCYPLIGLHPTSVNSNYRMELDLVERYLSQKKVYGIGEIGVDLYWSKEYRKEQRDVFASQVELATTHNKPIIIHSREGFQEILDVLSSFKGKALNGIFHAFTGDIAMYRKISSLGDFKIGIGGIVTFKNSGLAEVVADIPLEDIVLETDSPYLSPAPYRGKRNSPAYIPIIAKKIAEIKNLCLEDVALPTSKNAKTIFNI